VTQGFAQGATAGVAADPSPSSGVGYLVYLYGNYQADGHAGTDIGCPVGTPVRAARSGTVIWCDWDVNLPGGPNDWSSRWFFYQRFGGRLVLLQHAPGDIDVYAHLSAWKVRKGQFVNEGDLIALSGDSSGGNDGVLGPHLHQERIVDLNYPTGAGKIYGRIDPTTVWGGLSAQGTITQEDDLADSVDRIYQFTTTLFRQYHEASIAKIYDFTTTLFKQYHEASINETRAALRDAFKAYAEANGGGQSDPAAFAVAVAQHFDAIIDAGVSAVAVPATVTVEPLDIPAVAK
jgi:hypothetical protein